MKKLIMGLVVGAALATGGAASADCLSCGKYDVKLTVNGNPFYGNWAIVKDRPFVGIEAFSDYVGVPRSHYYKGWSFAKTPAETIEPLEIADSGHAHTIDMHVPDDLTMEGDQDRLRQLFTNVIGNALKHSPDDTAVLIETHENKTNDAIVTNVVNFGSQIPVEARSDIFRRFVKGKTGPGTESGGTGLGLSIARWAAQLHGGTVRVVDDPRGADFEITLPKHHIQADVAKSAHSGDA